MEKISGGTWPPTEVTWVGTLCQCGGLPAAAATAGGNHGTQSRYDIGVYYGAGQPPSGPTTSETPTTFFTDRQ